MIEYSERNIIGIKLVEITPQIAKGWLQNNGQMEYGSE